MMNILTKLILITLSLSTVFSAHAVQWEAKFNAQLSNFMVVGLSGPFPMFFIMDENNKTVFYGKGIKSQAYQQFAAFDFTLQAMKDDTSQVANAMLPNLIERKSNKPLNRKKLVVISLDEASFKTPEQDKCIPCRVLFDSIDNNQRKLDDMDKVLINVVHQNK